MLRSCSRLVLTLVPASMIPRLLPSSAGGESASIRLVSRAPERLPAQATAASPFALDPPPAPTTCSGDPGGQCLGILSDAVCECDCLAKEILVSINDVGAPHLINGPPNSQTLLSMAFAPGMGAVAGSLRMVFLDAAKNGVG